MRVLTFSKLPVLLPLCAWVAAAPQSGSTPPVSTQSWSIHSEITGFDVRQDAEGHRTAAYHGVGLASTVTQNLGSVANWQSLGPFGGDIDDVQVSPTNPSLVLAGLAPVGGGGGALYRSTDAGATWASVPTLDGRLVHDIAFAPNGTAYVGTIDGVWRSTDNGATFANLPLGIGVNDQVVDVDVDPSNPQSLWIGIADALGSQPVNVMQSTNGGVSWTNRTPPLASPLTCSAIAIDPTNSNRVFVGFRGFTGGGQVWVTTNGGSTWTNRSAGLPNRPINDLVHDGARVLVGGGQLFGSQTFGLYSSANDGINWTPLHDGTWPNLVVHDIALDPNNMAIVYVATAGRGLFRSTNGGTAWAFQVGGTGTLSLNAVSFAPGSSSTIYTGGSSVAVWRSVDAGATFMSRSNGIAALDVYSIDSNPLDADELAIAFQGLNNGGVYTSLDAGATWTLAAAPGTRYSHVRFSPQGTLYAISSGPSSIATEALYRRTGATWTAIGPFQGGLFESDLFGLRVSANDPDFIVAVGADFGVAGFEPTAWRTIDGGATWTKAYEGTTSNRPVQDVLIADPLTDTTFVASFVDFSGGGMGGALRSADSGVTWAESNTGLPSPNNAYSIARSPVDGALYLSNSASASGKAVSKSTDNGVTWSATAYVGQAFEVVTDETDADVLYIAQQGAVRVRRSSDGGATFTGFDTGLLTNDFPRDLQRAASSGGDLLLATSKSSFSTELAPATIGTNYCGPAVPNSTGSSSTISATGTAVVANNNLTLAADDLPNNAFGYFLTSRIQGLVPQPGGSMGVLCLGGSIGRYSGPGQIQNSGAIGAFDLSLNLMQMPTPTGFVAVTAGETWYFQAWHRDVVGGVATSNFSDGLRVDFQ